MNTLYIQTWNSATGYDCTEYNISDESEKTCGDTKKRYITYISNGDTIAINADHLNKTFVEYDREHPGEIKIYMYSKKCDKNTFMDKIKTDIAILREDYLKSDYGLFISKMICENKSNTITTIKRSYESLKITKPFEPIDIKDSIITYGKNNYLYEFKWNMANMQFTTARMAILDEQNDTLTVQRGSTKRSKCTIRKNLIGTFMTGTDPETFWMCSMSEDISEFKKTVYEKMKENTKLIEDTRKELEYYEKCNEALLRGLENNI